MILSDELQERRSFFQSFVDRHYPLEVRGGFDQHSHNHWHQQVVEAGFSVPAWPARHGGTGWSQAEQYLWFECLVQNRCPTGDPIGEQLAGPLMLMQNPAHWLQEIAHIVARQTCWGHNLLAQDQQSLVHAPAGTPDRVLSVAGDELSILLDVQSEPAGKDVYWIEDHDEPVAIGRGLPQHLQNALAFAPGVLDLARLSVLVDSLDECDARVSEIRIQRDGLVTSVIAGTNNAVHSLAVTLASLRIGQKVRSLLREAKGYYALAASMPGDNQPSEQVLLDDDFLTPGVREDLLASLLFNRPENET